MAVVALSFVSLTGCAHSGMVQATSLHSDNAPVVNAMNAAGMSGGTYAKRVAATSTSPIAEAMEATQAAGYAKRAQ
jgi:hypothetical protein